jgi:hypothetical protein
LRGKRQELFVAAGAIFPSLRQEGAGRSQRQNG